MYATHHRTFALWQTIDKSLNRFEYRYTCKHGPPELVLQTKPTQSHYSLRKHASLSSTLDLDTECLQKINDCYTFKQGVHSDFFIQTIGTIQSNFTSVKQVVMNIKELK